MELSALGEDELAGLRDYLATMPPLPFRYMSIHGPSKGRVLPERELVDQLNQLLEYCDALVLHPDAMEDPGNYRALGRKLLVENMDSRKSTGRTVEEIDVFFEQIPDAGFCFDIAHAWSVDNSMEVGSELLDAFGSRLRHLHVSSLSAELHHVPMTEKDETAFLPLLQRCVDVPWILEAPMRAASR